jgi:peptidyl-prolyl cis-trans isomerase C
MRKYPSPSPSLAAFSALFLLLGLTACSDRSQAKDPQGSEPQAASATAPGAGSATPGVAPAPGHTPQGGPSAPPLDPATLPAVVAKIGNTEIKKEELLSEAKTIQTQLAQRGKGEPATAEFYHQVLDGVIARRLLIQEAKTAKIPVPPAEVEARLEELRKRFPNPEEFKKAIASQGLTEERLRAELSDQLLVQKLITTQILPSVIVDDQTAKAFYDQNQAQMKQPERRHLRHILIRAEEKAPAADKAKAKAKADELLGRIKKGEDFAKLATENSEDPGSKPRGGDLSWISPGQTVPPFEQAAWALKPNEVSPVVETAFGFHIIQMLERQDATAVPFDQVKRRIISLLQQQKTQQAVKERVAALRAKSQVQTFV